MKEISDQLKQICRRTNISYSQLSQLLQVCPDTVSSWIKEINKPKKQKAEQIQKLAITSTKVIRKRLGLPDLEIDMPKSSPKWVWEEPIRLVYIDWPIVYAVGHIFCAEQNCEWRKNAVCPFKKCIKRGKTNGSGREKISKRES